MNTNHLLARSSLVLYAALLLNACASTAPDNSRAQLEQQLGERYPQAKMSTSAPTLENTSLDLDRAVQTLLTQSPQVRIALAQLGIANARQLQAELISNPHISIGALRPEGGGRWQLDVGLSQPLLELFTRPLRRQLAQENMLSTQLRLQAQLQRLIAKTGRAYYAAVAAQQHVQVQRSMYDATLARQQLAYSLYSAGNIPENNFLFYDNELRRAQQQLKQHEREAQAQYLELLNLIGLDSTYVVKLPTQLPALPNETFAHAQLLAQAKADRLELQIVRQQLQLLEHRRVLLGKENGWRDMTIGLNAEREFDGTNNVGPEIEFAVPLFNRNQGRLAESDALLEKNRAQLEQLQLDADSEIAQALNQMQSSRKQLTLIKSTLQVAEKRVHLTTREVNFMLGSPFELLEIKREEIQLAHDYTSELTNYWQARIQLELAIGRALHIPEQAADHTNMNHHTKDHHSMDHQNADHQNMDHSKMNHNEHEDHHHD